MKSLTYNTIIILFVLAFTAVTVSAQTDNMTLAWDPNDPAEQVAEYRLYYTTEGSGPPYNGVGLDQGDSPIIISVDNPEFDPDNPEYDLSGFTPDVTYYFALTAFNGNESGYSNEVSYITGASVDDDYDGYSENEGDCDDTDPAIHPGATEICGDGIDQDCSGEDLLCEDETDDDFDGYSEIEGDCDDTNPEIYPGAPEICGDGIDQDCSGSDLPCEGELAADYGNDGLWHYDGSWSRISTWNPDDDLAGWSSGLAVDFGVDGLWNHNGSSWIKISNSDSDSGGLTGFQNGVAADLGDMGLWHYDGSWSRISTWNPEDEMVDWSNGLAVDFGPDRGLWNHNGSSWSRISNYGAESAGFASWSGGLAVDFGFLGLWSYDGSTWSQISSWNAEDDLAGWPGGLAADFGAGGLWILNGSLWTRISNWNPTRMTGVANGLVVDFDDKGVWKYDGSFWSRLSTWYAENLSDCNLNMN